MHVFACAYTFQGGAKHFEYPKYVWSPSGGWWSNPRAWRKNTVCAFVIGGALTGIMWYISAQLEVRTSIYQHCFNV